MACDECRDLQSHAFSTHADLVNAVQVAAQELDRGVLARVETTTRSVAEEEAVYSAMDAGATPQAILYRFRCTVCGDRFTLSADTTTGEGAWTREDPKGARP